MVAFKSVGAPEICINNFYPDTQLGSAFTPQPHVNVANGKSNPLSNFFADLPSAQAVYPAAASLSEETDKHAWLAAALYVYNRDQGIGVATFVADGHYMVDGTIQFSLYAPRIVGQGSVADPTIVQYNGSGGTVDQNVPIFRFVTQDALGAAYKQPGSTIAQGSPDGCYPEVERITFRGKFGNMMGLVGNESAYVTGIQMDVIDGCEIRNCSFDGTLWDGIINTGASVDAIIEKNLFYGVYRDCISFAAVKGNFSTTMWIRDNMFSWYNRYGICLNLFGGIGATPEIKNNLFEPQGSPNFFTNNPQWYMHGVPANNLLYGCSQVQFGTSYLEININTLGFLHLVDTSLGDIAQCNDIVMSASINAISAPSVTVNGTTLTIGGTPTEHIYPGMGLNVNGTIVGILSQIDGTPNGAGDYTIDTSMSVTTPVTATVTPRSPAMVAKMNAVGWSDITDKRNYWAGGNVAGTNYSTGLGALTFREVTNISRVGGIGWTSPCLIEMSTIDFCFDYALDITKGRVALAVCEAGQIAGSVLTVDASANGSPFAVGQTVFGPGLLHYSPARSGCTIAPGGTGTGEAGTYNLTGAPGGTSAVQPVFAVQATPHALDDFGSVSVINSAVPELCSVVNPTTTAKPVQLQTDFFRGERILKGRISVDNVREVQYFSELTWREANPGVCAGNGYTGMTMNRAVADMTKAGNFQNTPLYFALLKDYNGNQTGYWELAGRITSKKLVPGGYTSPPTSQNEAWSGQPWAVGDEVNNDAPVAGGPSGWVCTAAGVTPTFGSFGTVSNPKELLTLGNSSWTAADALTHSATVAGTLDATNAVVKGITINYTSAGAGANNIKAFELYLNPGYTGSGLSRAADIQNFALGTAPLGIADTHGNHGATIQCQVEPGQTTSGDKIGVYTIANGGKVNVASYNRSFKQADTEVNSVANVGVIGVAGQFGSTSQTAVGGVFSPSAGADWYTTLANAANTVKSAVLTDTQEIVGAKHLTAQVAGVTKFTLNTDGSITFAGVTAANLPAATSALAGTLQRVTDCNTTAFGAVVAGGGTNSVMAHCNGTAWTVAAV